METTLNTLKNLYAQEQGYEDWDDLWHDHINRLLDFESHMNEICIRAQKAALEKAAENTSTQYVRPKTFNHKNGIKTDNRLENLEWCTVQENITHSIKNGLKGTRKGMNMPYKVKQPLRRKPINQYDLKGNLLASFESQTEASEKLGINVVYISRVCRRVSQQTFGCVFRFIDDVQDVNVSEKSINTKNQFSKKS